MTSQQKSKLTNSQAVGLSCYLPLAIGGFLFLCQSQALLLPIMVLMCFS